MIEIRTPEKERLNLRGGRQGSPGEQQHTRYRSPNMPRRNYYIVESPEASPGGSREPIPTQTGLSPMMQKVNLKWKFDEETESEEKEVEVETKRVKRQQYVGARWGRG